MRFTLVVSELKYHISLPNNVTFYKWCITKVAHCTINVPFYGQITFITHKNYRHTPEKIKYIIGVTTRETHPAKLFCPKNVVCLSCMLHIYSNELQETLKHGRKHYDPWLDWVDIIFITFLKCMHCS